MTVSVMTVSVTALAVSDLIWAESVPLPIIADVVTTDIVITWYPTLS